MMVVSGSVVVEDVRQVAVVAVECEYVYGKDSRQRQHS